MLYEVDVTITQPLDDLTRLFLDAVRHSVNRLIRLKGGTEAITPPVEVAGCSREDAIRAASSEVV